MWPRKQPVRAGKSFPRAPPPRTPHPVSLVALQTNRAVVSFQGTHPSVWAAGQRWGTTPVTLPSCSLKKLCSDVLLGFRTRVGWFSFFSETLFWGGDFSAFCSESLQSAQKWKGAASKSVSPTSPTRAPASPWPSRSVPWRLGVGAWSRDGVPRISARVRGVRASPGGSAPEDSRKPPGPPKCLHRLIRSSRDPKASCWPCVADSA